jgi:hypothetical protein
MQITISILGISVSVQDDDETPFTTIDEAKSYALELFDEVLKRERVYAHRIIE